MLRSYRSLAMVRPWARGQRGRRGNTVNTALLSPVSHGQGIAKIIACFTLSCDKIQIFNDQTRIIIYRTNTRWCDMIIDHTCNTGVRHRQCPSRGHLLSVSGWFVMRHPSLWLVGAVLTPGRTEDRWGSDLGLLWQQRGPVSPESHNILLSPAIFQWPIPCFVNIIN